MVQGKVSAGARRETFYGGDTKILISSFLFYFFSLILRSSLVQDL